MPEMVRVMIAEDDPYARAAMAVLLTRDWRTHVVAEAGNREAALRILHSKRRIDLVVLDTENPREPLWPFEVAEVILAERHCPMVCTGTRAEPSVLKRLLAEAYQGYVLKDEIAFALPSAVCAARAGQWVLTAGVRALAEERHWRLPPNRLVLDGRAANPQLTAREQEIARLAIVLNFNLRDLADELHLRADSVGALVSEVYRKLGVPELIAGEDAPEDYFEDERVLRQMRALLPPPGTPLELRPRKVPNMATLAFHLLTRPVVLEGDWGAQLR